jgi:hypothetical protein
MRIRSIKPEFWRSDDTAGLKDWHHRLIFIGLWQYVDDNGVGRDNASLIMSDLFPQEDDPREVLARIHRALDELSNRQMIVRYSVDGRDYLAIVNWQHQKIDRPSPPRYPVPPTSADASFAEPSAQSRESPSNPRSARAKDQGSGIRDQGIRGSGDQNGPPPPDRHAEAADPWLFTEFWNHYPWKTARPIARAAWDIASNKHNPDLILAAVKRYAADPNREERFTMKPEKWLQGECWNDGPLPSRTPSAPALKRSTTDDRVAQNLALVAEVAREEEIHRLQIGN